MTESQAISAASIYLRTMCVCKILIILFSIVWIPSSGNFQGNWNR
jgi:hypothetical protein